MRTGQEPDDELEDEEYDEEMVDIKKDLLLGHMLVKVARIEQQSHQSIRVLPSLALTLADLQLLPRYASNCLYLKPYICCWSSKNASFAYWHLSNATTIR